MIVSAALLGGLVALCVAPLAYWWSGPEPDPAWLYPLPQGVEVRSSASGCDTASTECGDTVHVSSQAMTDFELIESLASEYRSRGWTVEASGMSHSSNNAGTSWYTMVRPRESKLFFWTEQPTLYLSAESIGPGVVINFNQTRAPRNQAP